MKFLLVVLAVLLVVWLWRSKREPTQNTKSKKASTQQPPSEMVSCAHCGLHLPKFEAVAGQQRLYCCAEHLHLGEP